MFLSSTCSALSSLLQKRLYNRSPTLSPYEAVYWLSWQMLLVFTFYFWRIRESPFNVPQKHRATLVFRGIMGITSNALQITSLKLIALTKSSVIYWTVPIFTALFAHWHLKERITGWDWAACIMAFAGILIIQNPFSSQNEDLSQNQELAGTACAFLGAVTGGMTFVSVKKMGKEVHFVMSPFSWAVANLLLCPIFTMVQRVSFQTELHSYSVQDCLYIVSIMIFQLLNMTFATLAYQYEKAGRVSPIAYSQIFIIALLDVFVLGTRLSWNQWLGGAIIAFSNLSISILKCFELIK